MDEAQLAAHDLFVLGDPRDNALLARLLPQLPVEAGPGLFRFQGPTYADERTASTSPCRARSHRSACCTCSSPTARSSSTR